MANFNFGSANGKKFQSNSWVADENAWNINDTPVSNSPTPFKMLPAHTIPPIPQKPNYGAAWARGTLGSLVGRAITPLAEKATGRKFDISTLPESNTFGEKALGMVGNLGADLPLWLAGDMALAKPLSMLAKTKPIAKGINFLPKTIQPALGTGVRAAATFGGPINALDTAISGDGVEGFTNRLKEAPLMGLGGVALHGAGQAIGKGIKTGVDYNRFNKAVKLPEINSNPLLDAQNAFRNPVTLRTATSQQLNKTFADTPNLFSPPKLKPLQQGIDDAIGVRKPLGAQSLAQRELDAQSAFGGPIKSYKISNDAQTNIVEIQAKMDKQFDDIVASLKQADGQTKIETIRKQVKDMGGIKQGNSDIFEEQKVIPNWIRNKNGRPLDEVADTLGMSTDELLAAIDSSAYKMKDYETETFRIAYRDPEYQALSNTLDTLKSGSGRRTLPNQSEQNVVYHGTNKDFAEFDMSQNKPSTLYGPAFYFTDSLQSAKNYSTSYHGNTGNPRVISATLKHDKLWDYKKDKITPQQYEEVFNYNGDYPKISEPTTLGQLSGINDITGGLKELGYNGFKITEKDGSSTYAVFNKEQIIQHPLQPFGNSDKFKLKPREVKQPIIEPLETQRILPERSPLTWTNREVGNAGPLPIRSITQSNLGQLPGQRLQPPLSPRVTVPQAPLTPIPAQNQPRVFANDDGTIRPQVNRTKAKGRSISEMAKDVITQFIDDVAPLEKLETEVTGGLASAEKSIYKQARLFRGSPEQAAEFVRSKISPVLKKVEKQGKTVEDIGDYALAIHARGVNAKGINSGFSDERIAATIQKHGTPEMEAARQELMKINNELLDSLADAGIIEQSMVTALREKHPNYMPLFRAFDDEKIEFASGISKALANVSSPIKKLVGSDRDVIDPMESMIKNIYKTISAVDRNKVALQLGPLADKDTSGLIVRRLVEGEEKARLNTVFAMEGGKKVSYEVQPDVYKAIMGLDKESSLMLIKIFQQPANILRAGATLTPEFSTRNPIRDIPAAFSVSNSGLNPVRDIPMALFDIIRTKRGKDTMFNQFLKDNAGYGNIISTDRKVLQDAMKDTLSETSNKKYLNIVNPKSWLRVLRSIADVSESATKLGEYRAALRSGASRPEAAYRARDIMDFARAGASVREANKIVAFLNASLQGKSKLYRAIKENPVGVTARAFTSITLPTIGAFMAQKYLANDEQKKTIEEAPEWLTSTFWLVPIPGTDQVARIPKPFDLAPMFANAPERAMKYIYDNDQEAFDGFAKQSIMSMTFPTMVTGLTPLIEGFANYSFFKQGPIIPQREADLNFPDQYDIRTTETAKFIAKGVNKLTGGEGALKNFGSPRIIDNTIKGFTAGMGTYATSAIDLIAESTGLVDKKQKPARSINELPLLRAFLVSDKTSGKSMDKLYREKDRLTRERGSLKIDKPNPKMWFPQDDRIKELNSVTKEIGDMTKEIRAIENNKEMSPKDKRFYIDDLSDRRSALANKTMKK